MTDIFVIKEDRIAEFVKRSIIPLIGKYSIFAFYGQLGSGKTTIIKNILRQCGVKDLVTSPTFGYVNSYYGKNSIKFNHFDLYRIGSLGEFIDFGFDEYLYADGNINLIEWPEVIEGIIVSDSFKLHVCKIQISYDSQEDIFCDKRLVKISFLD